LRTSWLIVGMRGEGFRVKVAGGGPNGQQRLP
jgi:hypothetical protein